MDLLLINNETITITNDTIAQSPSQCKDGTFLPMWLPVEDITTAQTVPRGIVYLLSMIFLFIGIAYLADTFMSAIEIITSIKKEVRIKNDRGEEEVMVVRIWNQTIAKLTIIALGGASSEVFLATITLISNNFESEDLGPSEIVASAAFSSMVVIGVCVLVIPKGETRRINYLPIFLVVASWSTMAYVWLILVTAVISPGVVEVWEGLLTFSLFPCSLVSAYYADKYIEKQNKKTKEEKITYQLGFKNKVLVETSTTDLEQMDDLAGLKVFSEEDQNQDFRDFEEQRRDFLTALRQMRRKHPLVDSKQLELLATIELLDRGTKSEVFLRMKACKKLTGLSSWRMRRESKMLVDLESTFREPSKKVDYTEISFSPGHYTVEEDVGVFTATVVRQNGDLSRQVLVDYVTEDADALSGRDYNPARGTLCFLPGQTKKMIEISIIEDLVYEGDQHFYIRLFNPRVKGSTQQRRKISVFKGLVNPDAYQIPSHQISQSIGSNQSSAIVSYEVNKDGVPSVTIMDGNMKKMRRTSSITPPIIMEETQSRRTSVVTPPPTIEVQQGPTSRRSSTISAPNSNHIETLIAPQRRQACIAPPPFHLSSDQLMPSTAEEAEEEEEEEEDPSLRLACPALATVLIMDDDHHGIFTLSKSEIELEDSLVSCVMQIIRCGGTRGRVELSYRTEDGTASAGKDYQSSSGTVVFEDGQVENLVPITISEQTFYPEDLLFFFSIDSPKLLSIDGNGKDPDLSADNIPGHPELGEISKTVIRLKESKEFKNSLRRLIKRSHLNIKSGSSPWKQQFIDAIHLERDEDYEDEFNQPKPVTWMDYVKHVVTIFWRLTFAFIPPPELFGGVLTFFGCMFVLVFLIIFLSDLAYALGCTVGLQIRVTSLVLVSVGTSVPEMLASRVFAKRSPSADASVTNVFGSNIIQVYLGMGICWSIGSIYHHAHGEQFRVNPAPIIFMATLFICMSVVVVGTLVLRRRFAGGELGGSNWVKIPTAVGFFLLWVTFVIVNSVDAYGLLKKF